MFFYSREFALSVVKYFILVMPLVLFSLMPAAILMVNYSLLFDFALLALLLGLMRLHPTLLILILLPMSLSTIQLGNYLYTGQLIDVYTLMTFTATNQDEISGFTSLVVHEHPVLVSFFIFGLIISIAGVCFANMLSGRLITLVAISVMTLYFSLYHIKHGNFPGKKEIKEQSFYAQIFKVSHEFYNYFYSASYEQSPIKSLSVTEKPLADSILVIIGESATTYRMSAYGYKRNTTPELVKADVLMRNLVSVGLNTQPNVQALMTGEVGSIRQYHDQDIFRVAKLAGFKTYYVDNNRFVNRDPMYMIAKQSDFYYSLNGIGETVARNDHKIKHDELVLKPFQNALSLSKGEKRIIFVHLVGSHFNHNLRYPNSFKIFPSHYDNSIRYTDFIVNNLKDSFMASSKGKSAMVIYVGDHGVKIPPGCGLGEVPKNEVVNYTNDERFFSNMSPPLAFWLNAEFKHANRAKAKLLASAQNLPIDQRFLFWTLSDSIGVSKVNNRNVSDYSLFSKSANYLPRKNSHGKDIDLLVSHGEICK